MNKEALKENLGTVSDDEKVNEAYWTYASIWLDYYDDSLKHFFYRDIDNRPIKDLEEPDDETIRKAYLDEAAELAKGIMLSPGLFTVDEVIKEFPILEERRSDLEASVAKKAACKEALELAHDDNPDKPIFKTNETNRRFILIRTNGYSIEETGRYECQKDAHRAMEAEYDKYNGNDSEDAEWLNESGIYENDAILYNKGEDVYVWKIISA